MASKKTEYKKLSGNTFLNAQSTYCGDDHLLIVDGRYLETYRRLYYKDIEAILVSHTQVGKIVGIVFFTACLVFSILTYTASQKIVFWPFLVLSIISGIGTIVQFYGKGSSIFGIKTAVQTVIIHGLNTHRRVEKAEQLLAEKIEAVQGRLTIEELRAAIKAEEGKQDERSSPKMADTSLPPPLTIRPSEVETEITSKPAE